MPSTGDGTTEVRQRTVAANGIEFAVLEAGEGPLALCLHGFPDTAQTWRHLLPVLAQAGFHASAPFMRGYAPSGRSADGEYGLGALVADAVALHLALEGDERAVLIGHDWGAEAAYGAAAFAPDRWRRVVTLAVPPRPLDARLFADYEQLKRFFYLFFLATPEAAATVAADEMEFLRRLWDDWSPGYDPGTELAHVKRSLGDPADLEAAIAYYRAEEPEATATDPAKPFAAESRALLETPPQPVLYLHGERDGCIAVGLCEGAEAHLAPGSRMETIAGAGHFPQLERPDQVNQLIRDWLAE
jgi:pimeloyl-ACP methyl ester carboxylesterase